MPGCKGVWTVYHKNARSQIGDSSKMAADDDEYHAYLVISLETRTMVTWLDSFGYDLLILFWSMWYPAIIVISFAKLLAWISLVNFYSSKSRCPHILLLLVAFCYLNYLKDQFMLLLWNVLANWSHNCWSMLSLMLVSYISVTFMCVYVHKPGAGGSWTSVLVWVFSKREKKMSRSFLSLVIFLNS